MSQRYGFDADEAFQTMRDDFDASLPPGVELMGDEWWERFREFIHTRGTNGKARGERAEVKGAA